MPKIATAEEKKELELEDEPPLIARINNEPLFDSRVLQKLKGKGVTIHVENDIEKCHQLFCMISPKEHLFELWGFRNAFFVSYKYMPVFIVMEKENRIIGLLPLWYEDDKEELRWFGSWWQEANRFWIDDESIISEVLRCIQHKTLLNALWIEDEKAQKLNLEKDDPKYLLDLKKYPTLDAFLQKFNPKKRYNLKRDMRIIRAKNPKTIYNRYKDLEIMFDLSVKRFEKRDGSPFVMEERRETFRQICEQAGEYSTKMISTEIDGKIVGVDLIAVYNNTYYALQGAYDLEKHPGLGNYSNLLIIEDAIRNSMQKVDFLEVSYDWKAAWFDPIPLYQYKIGPNGREYQ